MLCDVFSPADHFVAFFFARGMLQRNSAHARSLFKGENTPPDATRIGQRAVVDNADTTNTRADVEKMQHFWPTQLELAFTRTSSGVFPPLLFLGGDVSRSLQSRSHMRVEHFVVVEQALRIN